MRSLDIARLAGIVEGEGTILMFKTRKGTWPSLTVTMTDRDVVGWVAGMFHTSVMGPFPTTTPRGRPGKGAYRARVVGAPAVGWLMTLYKFLGERRRAKIREVLHEWKAIPGFPDLVWKRAASAKVKGGQNGAPVMFGEPVSPTLATTS